jgi:hypothetical protein
MRKMLIPRLSLFIVAVVAPAPAIELGLPPSSAIAQEQPPSSELHQVTAGQVTAHFGGDPVEGESPLKYGVTDLSFTFADDQRVYRFRPQGELFFSDWSFDVFSPDGVHVLLLQDHYGPYHVVEVLNLKAYLEGEAEPDFVVSADILDNPPPSGAAAVHHDARWISPDTFQFQFTCCGETQTRRAFVKTFALPMGPLEAPRQ